MPVASTVLPPDRSAGGWPSFVVVAQMAACERDEHILKADMPGR